MTYIESSDSFLGGLADRGAEWSRVRREPRRDGRGERHRNVLAVRTPPGAVPGQGVYRLHPQRQSARSVQAGTHHRDLQPPVAVAGAHHQTDRAGRVRSCPTAGRRRRHPGHAHVHGHAWRPEDQQQDDDVSHARRLPRRRQDARHVSRPGLFELEQFSSSNTVTDHRHMRFELLKFGITIAKWLCFVIMFPL